MVIVYAPTTPEGQMLLANKVATAHANAVLQTIARQSCPAEQKKQLLKEIKKNYQKEYM